MRQELQKEIDSWTARIEASEKFDRLLIKEHQKAMGNPPTTFEGLLRRLEEQDDPSLWEELQTRCFSVPPSK